MIWGDLLGKIKEKPGSGEVRGRMDTAAGL
jgi:hypothetical protein